MRVIGRVLRDMKRTTSPASPKPVPVAPGAKAYQAKGEKR